MIGRTELQYITGMVADCFNQTIHPAEISVIDGRIAAIRKLPVSDLPAHSPVIIPGFVDAHIHIESSMLVPSAFARMAVVHGTVATVSDPHEIANVCGLDGIDFMIEDGRRTPFKFNFGAPSCVPATIFETAGAAIDAADVEQLLDRPEIRYLSEMMNFPGALHGDPEVLKKIEAARLRGKPVDGHAPGLRGDDARRYIARGISTDHECFTAEEALDKLAAGMKILIREGSAARNFEALAPLLHEHWAMMMFCSDDKHPDSLAEGHIDQLCARAAGLGVDPFKILQVACVNPVLHYKLDVGLLRVGDPADFILVDDLQSFRVRETWIDGQCVARAGRTHIEQIQIPQGSIVNRFDCRPVTSEDLRVSVDVSEWDLPVIEARDGQLITGSLRLQPRKDGSEWVSDADNDVLKIVVVNRYHPAPVARAFIRGFGTKRGALASSVAHDSHNIVAVGVDDASIARAVNLVIRERGGVSCVDGESEEVLPLPVGGLMSTDDGYAVAAAYTRIDQMAKEAGSTLASPFMTLSFMSLLVIPSLKLSDLGLFDGDAFRFMSDPAGKPCH
ncbi:MAG: adenine deaminase [Chitinophagaceae bacterium]